jgi:hypothetical protein
MNIVKFKDIIKEGDVLFNEHFKGKYCWCVLMTYCTPFNEMTMSEYIDCEQYGEPPSCTYIELEDYTDLVDVGTTDKINSIAKYDFFNSYALGPNPPTIDELKRFRTWLAEQLHGPWHGFIDDYFGTEAPKVHGMLNYYVEEMNDSTVQMLNSFVTTGITYTTYGARGSSCGCSGGQNMKIPTTTVQMQQNLTGMSPVALGKDCGCQQGFTLGGNMSINNCDPVEIYRNAMYRYMIQIFSDIDFWVALSQDDDSGVDNLMEPFKRYIDGIIQQNFPLSARVPMDFDDCSCMHTNDVEQARLMSILKDLSTAIQYIIDGTGEPVYEYSAGELTVKTPVTGHVNFCKVAFTKWATYLYERMRW